MAAVPSRRQQPMCLLDIMCLLDSVSLNKETIDNTLVIILIKPDDVLRDCVLKSNR